MDKDQGRTTSNGRAFVQFAIECGVLRFGGFKTKAGRLSPYFFNAGLFNDGASISRLAEFYAMAICSSSMRNGTDLGFDMLFGPAYKGIPLATAVAMKLTDISPGYNRPFAYNRKEVKDHGEGGKTIGAPLVGRVLIIDDVISAGTSVRESIDIICDAGATPSGVVTALDRMEQGKETKLSAAQEVQREYNIPVIAVATLDDLLAYLEYRGTYQDNIRAIEQYREKYGADYSQ